MFLASGAEAVITKEGDVVVKSRPVKGYRLEVIDTKLRKQRTKREVKILDTLKKANVPVPVIFSSGDFSFSMSFIEGDKVKDVLDANIAFDIGRVVGRLHSVDVIHSDLTTSNMILSSNKVHLIDFGLSFVSKKVEDKAVDLHLLRQALDSAHHEISSVCFANVLDGYKKSYSDASFVLERLVVVEKRGRNKK